MPNTPQDLVYAVSARVLIPAAAQSTQIAATSPLTKAKGTAASNSGGVALSPSVGSLKSKSQYILPFRQTLSHGDAVTRSLGIPSPVSEHQASSGKTTLISGPSTSFQSTKSIELPALVIGSQTITADVQNRYILAGGQSLPPGSTTTMGSGTFITVLAPQSSGTQMLLASGSSTALLSHATAPPKLSKIPPLLPIRWQNIISIFPFILYRRETHYSLHRMYVSNGPSAAEP